MLPSMMADSTLHDSVLLRGGGPPKDIMSKVYSQYWPANILPKIKSNRTGMGSGHHGSTMQDGMKKQSQGWMKDQTTKGSQRPTEEQRKVDMGTFQWQGWSQGTFEESHNPDHRDDAAMYKITKAEFKKLQDQIRDVSLNLGTRQFQGLTNRKLQLQKGGAAENAPVVYRSQLASSLKVFNNKQRTPLDITERWDFSDGGYYRCRPHKTSKQTFPIDGAGDSVASQETSCKQRPHTAFAQYVPISDRTVTPRRPRPRSAAPQSLTQTHEEIRPGEYDTLTPKIIHELRDDDDDDDIKEDRLICSYGDRLDGILDKNKLTSNKTSGKDSDYDSISGVSKFSDMSENENDVEPPVSERNIPELKLRPEKLDSLYIPEGLRDPRKFEFDAERLEIPPYEFEPPLSKHIRGMDLRDMAQHPHGLDWREQTSKRPIDKFEEDFLDKLMVLEKLQIETEEWEKMKRERLRSSVKQKRSDVKMSKSKGEDALRNTRPRDRKCCPNCVQPSCVGDCPLKKAATSSQQCRHCFQSYCDGSCVNTKYDYHSRIEPQEEDTKPPRKPRPKSCTSCKRPTTAKRLNANNVILGRPKSGHATYSTGRRSVPPKDLRTRPETPIHNAIEKEFEKLDIDPHNRSRPSTAKSTSCRSVTPSGKRLRGRELICPHKSYFSQRRHSLTDLTKLENASQLTVKRKRVRSAKRRPKT